MHIAPPRLTLGDCAIPLSEDEIRRRNEEADTVHDELDNMGDEDEQRETLDFLIKAIDEDRLSNRRRFRS